MDTFMKDAEVKGNIQDEENFTSQDFSVFIDSQVKDIISAIKESEMRQVGVKIGDVGVRVVKKRRYAQGESSRKEVLSEGEKYKTVVSKFLGIFRLQDEKGNILVKAGDTVKAGQKIAIVENMNIRNEIKADCAGTVYKILEDEGRPVEYGQILFLIEAL